MPPRKKSKSSPNFHVNDLVLITTNHFPSRVVSEVEFQAANRGKTARALKVFYLGGSRKYGSHKKEHAKPLSLAQVHKYLDKHTLEGATSASSREIHSAYQEALTILSAKGPAPASSFLEDDKQLDVDLDRLKSPEGQQQPADKELDVDLDRLKSPEGQQQPADKELEKPFEPRKEEDGRQRYEDETTVCEGECEVETDLPGSEDQKAYIRQHEDDKRGPPAVGIEDEAEKHQHRVEQEEEEEAQDAPHPHVEEDRHEENPSAVLAFEEEGESEVDIDPPTADDEGMENVEEILPADLVDADYKAMSVLLCQNGMYRKMVEHRANKRKREGGEHTNGSIHTDTILAYLQRSHAFFTPLLKRYHT
ncbi:hypothetical protein BDP27DRAFT_1378486 [Rhodocollybia butyracea]|uniref:Uncharacterized protein n=1 Tax=Rhodocollybia butyracea TaxID=206335 RepID=A0A9P5TVL2_9AGAR|nr:hypothetical protein BDP27DRAFT_1378486 [Rhodocollybia butyracea]